MIIRTQIAEYLDQPPVALFQDSDFYDRTVELILALSGGGGGSGTVTSVAATGGTGISITGSPITSSGTLNIINTAPDQIVSIASGTSISITGTYPSFTVTNLAPDLTTVLNSGTGISVTGTYPNFTITNTSPSTVTPAALTKTDDTNVTLALSGTPATALLQSVGLTLGWTGTLADSRIASAATWNAKQPQLNGTGFVKATGTTISYDNSTYLTGNQTITLSGDTTGSGATSITTTLATVNSNVGTFGSATKASIVTVNAKGLVTAASESTVAPVWGSITGTPTTLSGYGITDAVPNTRTVNGHALSSNVIVTADDVLPTQTGNNGKYLTTNGTTSSWGTISGSGTVTNVSSANSDATVATQTTTPVITINSAPKWSTARNLAGNSVDGSVNVQFANKFIVQGTTDTGLSSAQFLGALSTGIVKNTTTTGVLSIASAGSDYEVPITFSTGLTRTTNTVTVNVSQNITTLSNLTGNGFVKTSGGTGALSIDTSTYLIGNQTITFTGAVTGSGATSIATTLANTIVGIANLTATGTPSNTTYLRGDNTWATLPSGAGTVTSVGLSLPTEITVSNSPVTTTGTLTGVWANQTTNKFFAAPNGSTGTPSFRVMATTDLGTGSATSSTYLRGDLTWASVIAAPAGSTTQVQYNNAGTTDGATNVTIDTSDENLILLSINTTSAITTPSSGLKIWGDNRAGLDQLHLTPTIGIDYWLQPSIGQKVISQNSFGSSVTGTGIYTSGSAAGTTAEVVKSYDATNLLPNYSYRKVTSNSVVNTSAEFFVNIVGRGATMGNNTYGGGFKYMVTFGFPTYLSTERIFIGVTNSASQNATTTDPSAWLNMVGVAKDAADTTLQFMTNAGTGTATKVNTGITPNTNDVYRVTVFVPSNSASAYLLLERFTKSAATIADTTFTGVKLMGGTLVYTHPMVNTGAVASAVSIAIMNQQLEEF